MSLSFYEPKYDENNHFIGVCKKIPEAPEKVIAQTVSELKPEYYPQGPSGSVYRDDS